jgi:hypothetical protein
MLGDKRFKEPIRYQCGAWIIRFFYNFEEVYVIIDDRFAFCKIYLKIIHFFKNIFSNH